MFDGKRNRESCVRTFIDIRHFHLFCGLGGGAKGFNRGEARVGNLDARFRCIGGIDVDPAAIRDFGRLAGVPGTVLDLFSREQYRAFHGGEPPATWREATPDDLRRAAGGEFPNIVFLSAPCKGFSGLLAEKLSAGDKYQALNHLTLRGVWLMLEAFADDPPELIVFENVPRIASRGRALLDRIGQLLRHHGYAVAETTHDCGVIGGLAQSRKRFLLVARHIAKVPPFLYEPRSRPLRGVGEVLGKLPFPGDPAAGPMHRMPALQWKTWVRLAFVEAGSDWRSLNKLAVADGVLRDFAIMPEERWHGGALGVRPWEDSSGVITGSASPSRGNFSVADPRYDWDGAHENKMAVLDWQERSRVITGSDRVGSGALSVADPRVDGHAKSVQMGVRRWTDSAGVVTGKMFVGGGPHAVADPRIEGKPRFNNVYRIVPWGDKSPAIAGGGGPGGGLAVADPRAESGFGGAGKYRVTGFDGVAGVVISASTTGNGAFAVADPRGETFKGGRGVIPWDATSGAISGESLPSNGKFAVADPRPRALNSEDRDGYGTQGHYGVVPWTSTSNAITAHAKNNNGPWSVADTREFGSADEKNASSLSLPAPDARLVAVIRALDGTYHRPFTTLDCAALQSLVDPEEHLVLEGLSDSAWRERIGNAVPPAAAQAIASVMGRTILMARSGMAFLLSNEPIWVQPIALALTVEDQVGALIGSGR